MTENSKIFLIKNTIYNILAQQEFSIGLSLYIIKDIQQQLEIMYDNIVKQELKQEEQNKKQQLKNRENNIQKQEIEKQQDINEQIIDMSDSQRYPVKWTSREEENEDQAD